VAYERLNPIYFVKYWYCRESASFMWASFNQSFAAEQQRQCTYNLTVNRVRVTIVAVENQ